jgi:hypothetical protein
MLRITTESSLNCLRFLVEGKLIGDWAKELEQTWRQASKDPRAKIVDLSETQFIDAEGRRVLAQLHCEGASFRSTCPMIDAIITEIIHPRAESSGVDRESKRTPGLR